MRNAYVHYRNVLRYEIEVESRTKKDMEKLYPGVLTELRDQIHDKNTLDQAIRDVESMMQIVNKDEFYRDRGIDSLISANPNREAQMFLAQRRESHLTWVMEAGNLEEKVGRPSYGTERLDAMDSLNWAAAILSELNFLPN